MKLLIHKKKKRQYMEFIYFVILGKVSNPDALPTLAGRSVQTCNC
jgi:hypothetical protein